MLKAVQAGRSYEMFDKGDVTYIDTESSWLATRRGDERLSRSCWHRLGWPHARSRLAVGRFLFWRTTNTISLDKLVSWVAHQ